MRVLMTIDAVGGVWRYGVDLARQLGQEGTPCLLLGCGPPPNAAQLQESDRLRNVMLRWSELPLDWMVTDAAELTGVADTLVASAREWGADLLHLNLPSQAIDIPTAIPVVVASHSCLATWWRAVKQSDLPADRLWQQELAARGLRRADVVMVPTASHAAATAAVYGPLGNLRIAANATDLPTERATKEPFVLAAGRWWDEGKNAAMIDAAAAWTRWPVRMAGALTHPGAAPFMPRHAASLGALSPEAARAHMQRAAIFVSPALYEPFGLAALEAAASGCALVLSDIPTFRELWDDAARFVNAMNAAAIAEAINDLAECPAERAKLSRRALARAESFSLSAQAASVRQVYREAVSRT